MDLKVLMREVASGFSIAVPVDIVGFRRIRRALVEGRVAGFVFELAAATADA